MQMHCKQNEVSIYRGLRGSSHLLSKVLMEILIFIAAADAH